MKNKMQQLYDLLDANGRYLSIFDDGTYFSADKYYGTDGHYAESIDDLIEWESGYITAKNIGSREL